MFKFNPFLGFLYQTENEDEMMNFLKQLGGSPFVTNGNWTGESFKPFDLFGSEPFHSLYLFLGHKLTKLEESSTSKSLYFEADNGWTYKTFVKLVTMDVLKKFKKNDIVEQTAIHDFLGFLTQKSEIESKLMTKPEPEIFYIKELKDKISSQIDWLNVINKLLTMDSRVTEDDQILIANPELMRQLLGLFQNTTKE